MYVADLCSGDYLIGGFCLVPLTVRSADGATPLGNRRGENSELRAPTVVLDGTPRR